MQIFNDIKRFKDNKTCAAGEIISALLNDSLKNLLDQKSLKTILKSCGDIKRDNPINPRHTMIKTSKVFFNTFSLG
jgi:hypothetical protein